VDHPERWLRTNQRNAAPPPTIVPVTKRLSDRSQKHEQDTGFMSRERIAREIAAPILLRAANWDEAHRELAREGISYCEKGDQRGRLVDRANAG